MGDREEFGEWELVGITRPNGDFFLGAIGDPIGDGQRVKVIESAYADALERRIASLSAALDACPGLVWLTEESRRELIGCVEGCKRARDRRLGPLAGVRYDELLGTLRSCTPEAVRVEQGELARLKTALERALRDHDKTVEDLAHSDPMRHPAALRVVQRVRAALRSVSVEEEANE